MPFPEQHEDKLRDEIIIIVVYSVFGTPCRILPFNPGANHRRLSASGDYS